MNFFVDEKSDFPIAKITGFNRLSVSPRLVLLANLLAFGKGENLLMWEWTSYNCWHLDI